jgi:uncharacterized protein (DUF433 family)
MNLSDVPMPLRSWFEQTPEVLGGRLRLRDTRVSVEQVLELLEAGVTPVDIVKSFPSLSLASVAAVERLAAHCALTRFA